MSNVLRGTVVNPDTIYGKSAYEIAVMNGFDGTEEEWLYSLAEEANVHAKAYADNAGAAAARAEESSVAAAQSESNAEASASAAEVSANAADQSAITARESAQTSLDFGASAARSAESAQSAAASAAESAQSAAASAETSVSAKDVATGRATEAETAKVTAVAASESALSSATRAQSAAESAAESAGAAESAQSAAESAQSAAEAFAKSAKENADKAETAVDTLIVDNYESMLDLTQFEGSNIINKSKKSIEIRGGFPSQFIPIPNLIVDKMYYVKNDGIESNGVANVRVYDEAKSINNLSVEAATEQSFVASSETHYLRIYVESGYLKITNLVVVSSDSFTEDRYGQHISPDLVSADSVEKHIKTQNVIDLSMTMGGISSSTGLDKESTSNRRSDFVPVKKGYTYRTEINKPLGVVLHYDARKVFIKSVEITDNINYFVAEHNGYVRFTHNAARTFDRIIEYRPEFKNIPELYDSLYPFDFTSFNIPIIYFTGDISTMNKVNAVTLDYVYGDKSGTCTLKWQGSSSLTFPKKNYTVKFDTAFEASKANVATGASGWGEQKKYVLKADWVDFSHCRNVVSAKMWGQILRKRNDTFEHLAKLKGLTNGGAIDGFPCFVVINGKWQGIYNFNIPKDGWMLGMGEGTQEAIVCADWTGDKCSFKTTEDLRTDGNPYDFELEYVTDEDNADWVQTSLNTLIQACIDCDGTTEKLNAVKNLVDINSAIDYYILLTTMGGEDNIKKNYLLSTYDGTKWFFTPYDMDGTWGMGCMGDVFIGAGNREYMSMLEGNKNEGITFFKTVANSHKLMEIIYKYMTRELVNRYKELRNSRLSDSTLEYIVYNYANKIPMPAFEAEAKLWKTIPSTQVSNHNQILKWAATRFEILDYEIELLENSLVATTEE